MQQMLADMPSAKMEPPRSSQADMCVRFEHDMEKDNGGELLASNGMQTRSGQHELRKPNGIFVDCDIPENTSHPLEMMSWQKDEVSHT